MSALFYDGVDHMIEKITTLIKGKANNSHKHTKNDITDFPTLGTASSKDVASSGNASATQVVMGNDTRLSDARKASDVSAWAKASTKPTYTASEVGAYTKTETDTKLNGKANSSHTHGNGDITSLDAGKITSGTISIDRLPQGALDRLIKVVDDTARFKLTTKDVQLGDSVKVTSTKKMYIVVDETKLSSEDGYEPYTADSATSVPWSGVTGKPSTYTPSSHTHTKSQITDFPTSMPASDVSDWAKASSKPSYSKSEVGLGNVDNTADSAKSVKYATSAGSASSASKATGVVDYGATTNTIQIGYGGDGISGDAIKFIAGYTTGNGSDVNAKIKDVSKDALKSWLGLGSLAYSSATIPTIPSSLPANGGNSTTVNGYTVNSNVPANAKFTDTNTWRPQPDWNATSGDAMILNKPSIISAEPIEIESETSLNDVVNTGTYYCNYNKTYTNMPPSISNGWLCVSKVSDTIVKQVFLRHGTANTNDYQIYVRTKIGATWSNWTKVVTSKDYATTSDYGAIKLSTSVSNTSTALAATPSAVKIAYDKAVSAFSGKGLPYAIFDIASDVTTSAAWTETALQLKLQKSGAGDRVGSFKHGGSNFIYCPFSGIVDIDVNIFATAATNGYYYARCYKYNNSGDDELLDFAGLGGYTAAGCQGSCSMKVHVTAGTYIYINVAASTVIQVSASNSHIRAQYTMID